MQVKRVKALIENAISLAINGKIGSSVNVQQHSGVAVLERLSPIFIHFHSVDCGEDILKGG